MKRLSRKERQQERYNEKQLNLLSLASGVQYLLWLFSAFEQQQPRWSKDQTILWTSLRVEIVEILKEQTGVGSDDMYMEIAESGKPRFLFVDGYQPEPRFVRKATAVNIDYEISQILREGMFRMDRNTLQSQSSIKLLEKDLLHFFQWLKTQEAHKSLHTFLETR